MELKRIPIEDIYPDEKNPRKDFGDIDALAKSFELNKLDPGEPVNPIVVVQDGGIYRIVDGERRYKAMLKTKVPTCNAVVCDDMDEANAQIAMLTTDDKRQLTDIERSRGVQQMLLLGVDPVVIEKSARMKPGTASKVATARALVDDAGLDMTLDRMLAIEEFADDKKAIEKLTNCKESEWESLVRDLKQKRERKIEWAAIESELESVAIPVVKEIDKEGYPKYVGFFASAQRLHTAILEKPEFVIQGAKYQAERVSSSWEHGVRIYCDAALQQDDEEKEIDPIEEARNQKFDMLTSAQEAGINARKRFFADRLNNLDSIPNIMEVVEAEVLDTNGLWRAIIDFEESVGFEISKDINEALAVYGFQEAEVFIRDWTMRDIARENFIPDKWDLERLNKWIPWIEVFIQDGFVLNDGEAELYTLCKGFVESSEAEEEDTDGEDQ